MKSWLLLEVLFNVNCLFFFNWFLMSIVKYWKLCHENPHLDPILYSQEEAVVQHLYLGRNPPMFTEIRVLRESTDDDHLVCFVFNELLLYHWPSH